MRSVIDIETLKPFFCVTFLDYDSEANVQFEISSRRNQLPELIECYEKVKASITFNGVHFDNLVLNWLCRTPNLKKKTENLISDIYNLAQIVIDGSDEEQAPFRKYRKTPDKKIIDLFLYWSKGLRISKKLSLKVFAANMGMEVLEMPIEHDVETITEEEMDEVLRYNLNDCLVTKELANRLKEQINLRVEISKKYGMDCLSWDAPKIASEIMINFFCNGDKEKISNFKKEKYWFKNFKVGDYLPKIEFKTKVFQDVYEEACRSNSGFKKTLLFKRFDNTYLKIQYGSGGIHTVNSFEKFKSTNDLIISSDVESLYPTLFINNQFIRKSLRSIIEIFANIKADRVKAKAEGLKTENETLKLILNSFTGILDNQYSPFYSPEYIMALRIYGQLLMTRFAEECDMNKFLVVSQNTDGHEVIVPKERLNEYLELCERIEKEFNVKFEHHKYKFIYYHTVNSYLALSEKGKVIATQDFNSSNEIFESEIDGMEDVEYEVKLKDESDYQDKLDGANEYLIIALALKEKFVNGIEFSETIRNCKNLRMFTASKKSAKKFTVIFNGEPVQRLNRYIVSTRSRGGYLYKKSPKGSLNAIMKGQAVYLVNDDIRNADPKDYPIDYSWYERKCQERYEKFYSNQLTLA
jgi:hypothetical protein